MIYIIATDNTPLMPLNPPRDDYRYDLGLHEGISDLYCIPDSSTKHDISSTDQKELVDSIDKEE